MSSKSAFRRNHSLFVYAEAFLMTLFALLVVPHANALKGRVTRHRHHQSGEEYGGQQPISGSRVYLFAISTTGYGSAPQSLLTGQGVSYDTDGHGYVLTDANGGFGITDLYVNNCPANDAYVYLQARGGDPGDGSDNSAIDLISVMPSTCLNLPTLGTVNINELTTVAAAWGMLRYAYPSTMSFSSSSEKPQALQSAVEYTNSLVSGSTAAVGTTTYNGSLTIPGSRINAMGDIIAQCVNAPATSFHCTDLFDWSPLPGGVKPVDTFQAAIGIALNPDYDPSDLFGLIPAQPPFPTGLTQSPHSWTITYGLSPGAAQQTSVITIDHTKVSNSAQTNFPVAI